MVLLLAAHAAFASAEAREAPSPESQIRASLAGWVIAFNSGDYKAALKVWAPDLIGWAPEGSDDTYAREEKDALAAQGKQPTVLFTLEIVEVTVSGDMALVRDIWTETPRSDASKARRFRSFEIWRRQPDTSWKISRWIDGPTYAPPRSQQP
jgi:ketosteroid isomerase-like protein